MAYVSRDEFLKLLAIDEQEFALAGLGTVVYRPLSLDERQTIMERHQDKAGKINTAGMMAECVVAGLVNPKLTRDDIAAIRKGKAAAIDELAKAIVGASGMGDEFEGEAGDGS